jgi:tetratricopeptide (TPR) repeat protein
MRKSSGMPGTGAIIEEQGKVIPRRRHTRIGFFGIGAGDKRPPEGSAPGWLWFAIGAVALVIVIVAAIGITTKEPPFSIPGATQLQASRADSLYKALKTDSLNAGGHVKLGDLLYDTQNFERAAIYYRRALALDPTLVDAQVDLAVSLHQSNRSGEALAELNDVLSRQPQHVIAHFDRGVILEFLGRLGEAEEEYMRVLELDARPEVHDTARQRLQAVQRKREQLPEGHP